MTSAAKAKPAALLNQPQISHNILYLVCIHRLGSISITALPERLVHIAHICQGGHHNNLQMILIRNILLPFQLADYLQHLQTVHLRHHNIKAEQIIRAVILYGIHIVFIKMKIFFMNRCQFLMKMVISV